MYINRELKSKIININNTFPVLMLTGPRQVGKTTLLKELDKNRTFVTFDDPIIRMQTKQDPAWFFKKYKTPILIDEIQYVPEILPYIKMRVDESNKPGEFWITGSQKFNMMKSVTESLAGRVACIDLIGISYDELTGNIDNRIFLPTEEYLNYKKDNITKSNNIFENIFRGSMPRILSDNSVDREIYYSSYVQTYLERDVKQLTQVADEMLFMRFLISIAARTGEQLNYTTISNDVGITVNTVKHWLSILETSGIIYVLPPYENNILTRMNKMNKVYFLDTGLCAYLTKWESYETLENSSMAGNFFETYVVSEIIKKYYNNAKRPQIYYYRDKDKVEIDLIINYDNILYPIEIKKGATPQKNWIKNFHILKKLGKEIGNGGIICNIDDVYPIDDKNNYIPVEYI